MRCVRMLVGGHIARPISPASLPPDLLKGITSIGKGAFHECSRLTALTLPEGITSIGDLAFEGCSGLTALTLPEGLTSIGDRALVGCSGLTSIQIAGTDDGAFGGCSQDILIRVCVCMCECAG